MLDFPLMLRMSLPVVNRVQPQSNKVVMGLENKATGNSKLKEGPVNTCLVRSL